jgi:hypothetical protein
MSNEIAVAIAAKEAGFTVGGFALDIEEGKDIYIGYANRDSVIEGEVLTGKVLKVRKFPTANSEIAVVVERSDRIQIPTTLYPLQAVFFKWIQM